MSDKNPDGGNGPGVYDTAKDAIASAAEKVRAAAPDTYDAGARAARYVGETASEHPTSILAGAVGLAFLGWLLAKSLDTRPSWQKQARSWQERSSEMTDRARSAAPDVSRAADETGEYVSQTVREYPMSGLLVAAAVGGILTYLLQPRP